MTALPLALISMPRSFVELDDRLVAATAGDRLVVRAPAPIHDALRAHVARRLRASGWRAIDTAPRRSSPSFRDLALRLGVDVTTDPVRLAEAIAATTTGRRVAVVGPLPAAGSWDEVVASELTRSAAIVLVLVTTEDGDGAFDGAFDVSSELTEAEKLRWLGAMAEDARTALAPCDVGALEAWWSLARAVTPTPRTAADLSPPALRTFQCLALARRALPRAAFGEPDELVVHGLAVVDGDLVSLRVATGDDVELPVELRRSVAECLRGFDPDPWAQARAAELFIEAGAFAEADAAIECALRGAGSHVSAELAARWFDVVTPVVGAAGVALRIEGARRSLRLGEAFDARRWCESAAALGVADATLQLLMGRASMQLGDLVSARVCFAKAESLARDDQEMSAQVTVERAELSYAGGDLDGATAFAEAAIARATTATTRLAARGTAGKVLLARGAWERADEHFAEDTMTASAARDTTAELRARLNRAIALLSNGDLAQARIHLERVLEDATRLHEDRARAYALSNLGLVAYRQRDYGAALRYWEDTSRLPQALRGRLATAITIGNLAELRLRLGLVDHAEHAIVFGRKLIGPDAPPRASAHFGWVSALVALARGETELARREADSALASARASGDRDYVESASIVAIRVALAEGDLDRARTALSRTQEVVKSPRACAELAIVRAASFRAMGQTALPSANEALDLASAAGEEDLLLEILTLLVHLHRDAGDLDVAQRHHAQALGVRDQIAAAVSTDIRAAFLARPDVVALSRSGAMFASESVEDVPAARVSRREPAAVREMIGDDPQIRGLALAIRKVARSNSTVLVRGESGTGKELVAEALHRASERASGPLVTVNCAALVETLLLSELFGHERGAFTGAASRRRGRFEVADGGTLFLDEIGDISPRTQVALLRVLQEKTFERVGGAAPIQANVRVVCATHRDLRAMVDRGEFREDLYYRLRQITLEVPALRARLGDLPRIAEHLLGRMAAERGERTKRLSADALDLLGRHRWPGNVRELENVLRAAAIFADTDVIGATDLIDNVDELRALAQSGPTSQRPIAVRGVDPGSSTSLLPDDGPLPDDEASATSVAYAQVRQGAVSLADIKRQIERDCIARALAETGGNITHAATILGMKRPRLSQLVKQYGLSATPEASEG